jgi:hypothetical protein
MPSCSRTGADLVESSQPLRSDVAGCFVVSLVAGHGSGSSSGRAWARSRISSRRGREGRSARRTSRPAACCMLVARSGAAPRPSRLSLRGAGGNRTPVRRAVADRATTIPEIYGSAAAAPPGRWASRRRPPSGLFPMSAVFPAASGLSRRQPPLLLPGCGDQAPRAITGRWVLSIA